MAATAPKLPFMVEQLLTAFSTKPSFETQAQQHNSQVRYVIIYADLDPFGLSMAKDRLTRKLALILHADVVGSTKLVQQNETLAHERIQATFHHFSKTINAYGGIAREIRGDALVAEFERASDAVTAALAFQVLNGEINSALDDDIQPQLRIGISLGEVIIADNTITGEGVVLAQRLEQLADPGGVVVQGSVSETVPTRMPFEFESLGEQKLKGFDQPVRAFAVKLRSGEELPGPEANTVMYSADPKTLQVPDKPSIAVLPFDNMSGDPEQEYFSDGITEDVITELSRFHSLFVIARNSSSTYKGRSVNVKEVASDLGVQYVVEGSVRRVGNHIRVTVQLVEAEAGNHIWAERYDRQLEDIFAVQDEIVESIVSNLEEQLVHVERDLATRKSPSNLDAYDYLLRGRGLLDRQSKNNNQAAIEMFNQALKLSPDYALAYAYLAICYIDDWKGAWSGSSDQSLAFALDCAKRAESLDDTEALGHGALGMVYARRGEYAQSQVQFDLAISYNPNDASCLAMKGLAMTLGGSAEKGLRWIKDALRRNPLAPGWAAGALGIALYTTEQYTESILTLETKTSRFDSAEILAWLAAGYAQIGNEHKARSLAIEYIDAASAEMAGDPPTNWSGFLSSRNPFAQKKDIDHFLDGLHKAGLEE